MSVELIRVVPFRPTVQHAAQCAPVSWPPPAVKGGKETRQRRAAGAQISTRKESLGGLGAAPRLGNCLPGVKTQMLARV